MSCTIQNLLCFLRPQQPEMFTPEEFQERLAKLHKFCLSHLQDSYRVHLNRLKGVELLEEIIQRADFVSMEAQDMMSLIWCCLSCVHHFYIRIGIQSQSRSLMDWSRKRQEKRAMRVYEKLISLTTPEYYNSVVAAIIKFYTESNMWNTEYLCAELLGKLLHNKYNNEKTVHAILDVAETSSLANINEARQVIRVLYQILHNYPWTEIESHLLTRLLTMFHKSIMPSATDKFDYAPLHKGLEVCLRNMLENLPKPILLKIINTMLQWTFDDAVSDDAILDFGNILEYAAMLHETSLYRDSLSSSLFPLILNLISSENNLHSLLGNRVLQNLMDRHNNKNNFETPQIYLDDVSYGIVISQYTSDDKAFIRKYREIIHSTLLASIQLHGVHRINLESTYASIAIIVVEIPCGYTAAAVVCLAMAIQEYAINDSKLEMDDANRIHAIVMAIMSLVCWVHSAQVFYDYLKSVVARRARFAPHLNPPLRANYQYAQHHILWNKPELFFEDWEARYGLWKCFRTRRTRAAGTLANIATVGAGSQQDIV